MPIRLTCESDESVVTQGHLLDNAKHQGANARCMTHNLQVEMHIMCKLFWPTSGITDFVGFVQF